MGRHVRLFPILCLAGTLLSLGCQSSASRRVARNSSLDRVRAAIAAGEASAHATDAADIRDQQDRYARQTEDELDRTGHGRPLGRLAGPDSKAVPSSSVTQLVSAEESDGPTAEQPHFETVSKPDEAGAQALLGNSGHSVRSAGSLDQPMRDSARLTEQTASRTDEGRTAWWGLGARATGNAELANAERQAPGRSAVSDRNTADTGEDTAEDARDEPGLARRTADAVSDTVGLIIGTGEDARGRILGVRAAQNLPDSPGQELASVSERRQSDQVWEEHVLTLIDMLGAEVAGGLPEAADARRRSEYVSQQVKLRLLYLIAGDPARAYEAIPEIDPVEQEFWQHTFFALWKLMEERKEDGLNESERAAEALAYLHKAALKLGAVAPLKIRTMAFCSEIESFGSYHVIPDSRFPAGERVLVYTEVENFASEPLLASNGKFQTKLRSTLEVFPAASQPSDAPAAAIVREELPTTVDLCARQRRDYFNAYTYTLPDNLQPGYYTLKVTIVDELSGSVADESIPFEIAR